MDRVTGDGDACNCARRREYVESRRITVTNGASLLCVIRSWPGGEAYREHGRASCVSQATAACSQ